MCFYIDKVNCPESLIAEKDIRVYKRLIKKMSYFISPYKSFKYISGEIYFSILEIFEKEFINKGFHHYTNLKEAISCKWDDEIICEFIIPKGSKYYINEKEKEIVSNQTKWTGRVYRTDRFIEFKGKVTSKMFKLE